MMIQRLMLFMAVIMTAAASQADTAPATQKLMVMDAFARAAPRVMKNGAAYMILHNLAKVPRVLTGVRSEVAAHSQLHRSTMAGGMMKMMPVKQLVIPANGVVQFQPGGYHIMLMGLKHALREGDRFYLSLEFADGSSQRLEVPVRGIGAMPPHQHQPGHEHQHDHKHEEGQHKHDAQGG